MKTFSNKYGVLSIEQVGQTRPVSQIHIKNIPEELQFSLERAEQMALITENRKVQFLFDKTLNRVAMVYHESSSTCWVAKVTMLRYAGPNAQKELASLRGMA